MGEQAEGCAGEEHGRVRHEDEARARGMVLGVSRPIRVFVGAFVVVAAALGV